ncbi:MAG: UDP-3-O-(3-hydroxymyristoyl)glucosamine N-acyltransferase [Gemmatimonadota bacterium]|nr:MAG: UDP-3-O-(3-hydroxymyristoyl)glucosamine N-acyltransferase [Gemmatimonadota bacterium]
MKPEGLAAGTIAELVGGRLVGRADITITGTASLDRAGPLDLSFLDSSRYATQLACSQAGAVLLTSEFADTPAGPNTRIIVSDPRHALIRVMAALYPKESTRWGVHPTATVGRGVRWQGRISLGAHAHLGANVQLGEGCCIGEYAQIGDNATLGDECCIGPHAVVCPSTEIGDRVVIKSGARVGTPGYAFVTDAHGHEPVRHVGRCVIESDVEIGANTTVDRGSLGETVVGKGTKIDNLVQVGHNVRIGQRCLIMAQVGLAGSTVLEDDVILAGQAGLAGHLTVGKGARVAAQGGVIGDIAPGATVSGYPARPHREVLRQAATLSRLTAIAPFLERMVERDS